MKKTEEKIFSAKKISVLCFVLVVAIFLGDSINKIVVKREVVPAVQNTLIKVEKQIDVPLKSDSLPLDNEGKVVIEIVDDRKIVYISYEDLEYISKKKSRMKKLVKNLDALFSRLQE